MAVFVSTDVHIESPVKLSPQQGTDSPAGFAGSAGRPCRLSEPPFSDKPPLANREVEITPPPENRSLIDWASFTFKLDDPLTVANIIGLDPSLFTKCSFGFSGYRQSLKLGNISIYFDGRENMGCHVEMTGQGCRQYEGYFTENPWQELFQTVLAANGKFTRLDLAIDNVDGALTLERVWNAIQNHEQQIRTQFQGWRRMQKGSFEKGKQITGDTIYLGSQKSNIQFRMYDKAQESNVTGHWIRFEIQLRDTRAHEAAKLLAEGQTVGSLTTGIINNYFSIINNDDSNKSRCSLQPWWAEWLQATSKIKLTTAQAIKLVSDTMEFIKRQYAPSLAMIKKHLGTGPFKSYVQEIVEDGNERMTAKHEKILAATEAAEIGRGLS